MMIHSVTDLFASSINFIRHGSWDVHISAESDAATLTRGVYEKWVPDSPIEISEEYLSLVIDLQKIKIATAFGEKTVEEIIRTSLHDMDLLLKYPALEQAFQNYMIVRQMCEAEEGSQE